MLCGRVPLGHETAEPGGEVRAELWMVDSQPDHGLEIVQPVSRVIATATEDHAVHASSGSRGCGAFLQGIGQLDLVATAGLGLGQDLEYRRVEDVAPDDRQIARSISGIWFLDQPRDANHGSVTVIRRTGGDRRAPIQMNYTHLTLPT